MRERNGTLILISRDILFVFLPESASPFLYGCKSFENSIVAVRKGGFAPDRSSKVKNLTKGEQK